MKIVKICIGMALVIVLVIFAIRLFSSEDDWICSQGQWVMHGNPSASMPQTECR